MIHMTHSTFNCACVICTLRLPYDGILHCTFLNNLKNVLKIPRLQSLHDISGFIHRDLKPENILVGLGGEKDQDTGMTQLYLVDLGLAKAFCRAGRHIGMHDRELASQYGREKIIV